VPCLLGIHVYEEESQSEYLVMHCCGGSAQKMVLFRGYTRIIHNASLNMNKRTCCSRCLSLLFREGEEEEESFNITKSKEKLFTEDVRNAEILMILHLATKQFPPLAVWRGTCTQSRRRHLRERWKAPSWIPWTNEPLEHLKKLSNIKWILH
jgi:hypothetical protein